MDKLLEELFGFFGLSAQSTVLIGLIFLLYKVINNHITSNEANQKLVIAWLEQKYILEKYRSSLGWVLGKLQGFYGEADSGEAFYHCFIIASIYPFVLFLIVYSFFSGISEFAGVQIFTEMPVNKRPLFVVQIILLAISIPLFIITFGQMPEVTQKIHSIFYFIKDKKTRDTISGIVSMTFFIALFLFIAGLMFITGIRATQIIISFVIMFSGGVFVFSFFTAIIMTIFSSICYSYSSSYYLLIFLLIFPSFNALLDWFSLRVSRYCLFAITQESNPFIILIDLLIDLICALGFMLILVLLFPSLIEWSNYLVNTKAIVDWRSMAETAINDPWGKGLMVTMMLITTLLPTFLHFFLALLVISIQLLFGQSLAKFLKKAGESTLIPMLAAIWIEAYCCFVFLIMFLLYSGWQKISTFPIGEWLYQVAEWGQNQPIFVIILLVSMLLVAFLNPLKRFFS